jgi:hypothetical protein
MQPIDHRPWFPYRGLPPHQFMPMLGVHKRVNLDTRKLAPITRALELSKASQMLIKYLSRQLYESAG